MAAPGSKQPEGYHIHDDKNNPGESLLRANFSDLEEACAALKLWDLDVLPLTTSRCDDETTTVIQLQQGSTSVLYTRARVALDQRGGSPSGKWSFEVVEENTHWFWSCNEHIGKGVVAVYPDGGEIHCQSGPDYESYVISIDEQTVEEVCESFQIHLPSAARRPASFHLSAESLANIRQHLRPIHRVGNLGMGATDKVIQELIRAWLEPSSGRTLQRASLRTRDRAITRCLEFMDASDLSALSLGRLCDIGLVSERTLEYAFRERFGITPSAYVKARRLINVRRQLLANADLNVTIGEIANSFGFFVLGQFSVDYRRAFGETPSQTLRKTRLR